MSDSVKFGDPISLKHNYTGRFLVVLNKFCESGSEQQVVAAGGWEPTEETTFTVIPRIDEETDGDVHFGDVIRLEKSNTGTKIRSHPDSSSPITGQQEVTCVGSFDVNDEWIVEQWIFDTNENNEYDPEDNTWYLGRSFLLRHAATGLTLHSHDERLDEDNNEVTCYGGGPDENDRWRAFKMSE